MDVKMDEIFKEIGSGIDVNRLIAEIYKIEKVSDYHKGQICLQYAKNKSWHEAIPTYFQGNEIDDEQSYVNWHDELQNSYIKQVLESFGVMPSHARIMKMPGRSCYTTHVDYFTRYHVPIITNPLKSYMHFPDKNVTARMYPGKAYWTNTHELHNFINGTIDARIHLIFNDAAETKNLDNHYLRM